MSSTSPDGHFEVPQQILHITDSYINRPGADSFLNTMLGRICQEADDVSRSNSPCDGSAMRQRLGDLVALLRCARLAVGLFGAIAFAWRALGPLTEAYDMVIAPIVERTITDLDERANANRALRAMSAKIGLAMLSYARLAGSEERLEVAALAGTVTRLYDDLIDACAAESVDERLSDLFNARPFTPGSDLERLLAELVTEIRQRVHPLPGDTVDVALSTLHEYQCLSRRQREEAVPLAVLEKITRGKGAMANLTLCSLVKPAMDAAERELVMALGETFQSLDDYMDVERDISNGILTLASLGVVTLKDIGLSMCAFRERLASQYGRSAARPYCGMIFFLLVKSAAGRRLPAFGRISGKLAERSAALTFLTRGMDVIPVTKYLEDR